MAAFITHRDRVLFDKVVKNVERIYGVRADDLLGTSRAPGFARPRQMAYYALHRLSHCSYPVVAALFKRDHTSVVHGVQVVEHKNLVKEAKALLSTGVDNLPSIT